MRQFRSNQGRNPRRNEHSYQVVFAIGAIALTLFIINLLNQLL